MATPIVGIDFNAALAQFKLERVFLRILTKYRDSIPDVLEQLSNYVEKKTPVEGLDDYITTVHGLKGASYGIFANDLGDLAKDLEFAARDGRLDFVSSNNGKLVLETNALLKRIDSYLNAAS
ncbi:MAG: hypothetical protein LBG97_09365 [Coriobacteriales bacterium]|jgi:hypothetical protein|nr:hypothetical protein [Coriobacteriales bacterium]